MFKKVLSLIIGDVYDTMRRLGNQAIALLREITFAFLLDFLDALGFLVSFKGRKSWVMQNFLVLLAFNKVTIR